MAGYNYRRCPASTILAELPSRFAGSPQRWLRPQQSRRVAGLRQSGSGDVEFQDDGVVHDPVNRRGGGHRSHSEKTGWT